MVEFFGIIICMYVLGFIIKKYKENKKEKLKQYIYRDTASSTPSSNNEEVKKENKTNYRIILST